MHDETINADLTHDISHSDKLTDAEQQNIHSRSSLNARQTQAPQRACAQKPAAAQKAGGPGAKRQDATAVKKMEQHSTEYKLSSNDAATFHALSARANDLSQDKAD